MNQLEPPYSHYVSAAQGWLELGSIPEAEGELARLPAALLQHHSALMVQWEIMARRKDWEASLAIAKRIVEQAPDDPDGWIKQSFSLHELKRTEEARDSLLMIEARFPRISIIPYNLACYACQLGDTTDAMRRLKTAIKIGGKERIKGMALQDLDLKPLQQEILLL